MRAAAAIGGDFYDLSYSERVLTVSLADVSGHGLPTGLAMAAAKASLGMLARTGAGGVRLMELLHEEILRTTEPRTFVTLAHLVFDLANGTVAFTNAGHPYPYRVDRDGTVEALANPARPLGLTLSGGWHTVAAPLVLPSTLFGANAPSNKLNIALLGTWGRGEAHFGGLSRENSGCLARNSSTALPGWSQDHALCPWGVWARSGQMLSATIR